MSTKTQYGILHVYQKKREYKMLWDAERTTSWFARL